MSDTWYISGPLEIGGTLIATKDGDELIGLRVHTDFDDNGKSNVKHYGLIVIGPVAMGQSTTASGEAATAMGVSTTASGLASTAMGVGTTANGEAATATGASTTASEYTATAMGAGTTASAQCATAMGASTTASGRVSTAMGESTAASGLAATAMGAGTKASEYAATAMGESTTASGRAATAMGQRTTASGPAATAMGIDASATHERSFVWSDGSGGSCLSMNHSEFRIRAANGFWVEGTAHATGGWAAAGNDYAEYFESTQGQKIEAGMTVALAEGKIRVAQAGDTPIGVISANPVVLGGANPEWPKKYMRDECGQVLTVPYQDEVMVHEVDDQGKPVVRGTGKFVTKQRPRINPAYDPTKQYIPRAERPEWNCVGLLGQLPVRKGQVVAPNWIKMRELSPNVDLWLVK